MPQKTIYSARYKQFCALLIEERKKRGITQTVLAERLGRPPSFVAKIELGDRRLDVIEFLDVANALGADALDILKRLATIPSEPSENSP